MDDDNCRQSIHAGFLGKTFETGATLRDAIDAARGVTSNSLAPSATSGSGEAESLLPPDVPSQTEEKET